MQDQTLTSPTPEKSASQSPEFIVTTKKEGFIALIIGIVHLIVFPLALNGVSSYFWLDEVSAMSLLVINAAWLIVVAAVLGFFLKDFLKRSWVAFRANPKGKFVLLILIAWVLIYAGNMIVNLLIMPAFGINVLDSDTINTQMSMSIASPVLMILMAGILAPVVEESLFRGALFGRLHLKSSILAYVISITIFAFAHVWQFALSDPTQLINALSWIPMGIGFAFVYRRTGNVFAAITLHMICNIIAVLAQILLMTA
ncbi:MAG: CPBP family intramembrane metalloprotease [Candidatus Bathyarchaeota archaeon]|nr:CPBP family intramembrane metalloprotease [Candidatus Termiticorpusculum sp.]